MKTAAVKPTQTSPARLRLLKLYFFIFIGAGGFLMPFINLYYERQGLSGTRIGMLGTFAAVTALLVAPFIGQTADRVRRPLRLLQFTMILTAVFHLLISQQSTFWPIAILVVLGAAASAGIEPLSTVLALDSHTGDGERRFGSIRVWGSLGWAVTVLVTGYLIEKYGLPVAFAGFAGMYVLSALVLEFLHPGEPAKTTDPTSTYSLLLGNLLRDRSLLGLSIALVLLWASRAGIWQFQALYLDSLGAGEGLIGISSMIGAVIELPGMIWADRIAHRSGSHQLLKATFILYALTAGLVLALPAISTIIAAEAIGGIAYSFLTVSLVLFIDERTPPGKTTTALAVFTVTLPGLTRIFSSPLSGLAYDRLGAYWLYAITAAGCVAGWFVLQRMVSGERSRLFQNTKST